MAALAVEDEVTFWNGVGTGSDQRDDSEAHFWVRVEKTHDGLHFR